MDFVGYITNPHYVRGEAYGEAAIKTAPFRQQRLKMQSAARDPAALKAERAELRAAAGEAVLPTRYKRVTIKVRPGWCWVLQLAVLQAAVAAAGCCAQAPVAVTCIIMALLLRWLVMLACQHC